MVPALALGLLEGCSDSEGYADGNSDGAADGDKLTLGKIDGPNDGALDGWLLGIAE